MRKRVTPFQFSHRISHRISDLSIFTAEQEQFHGIDSQKKRSFEVRIKIGGLSKCKTFATLQQCRTWARCAETELSETLKPTNRQDALATLVSR